VDKRMLAIPIPAYCVLLFCFIKVTIFSAGIISDVFNILHNLKTNDFARAGYIESLLYKNSKGRVDEY